MSNPTCPYCGAEMRLALSYVHAQYECRNCHAKAPYIAYDGYNQEPGLAGEEACAAAMQRWQEPLKPLALREVAGSEEPCVYMEIKGNETIRACDCVISGDLQCIEVSWIGNAMSSWMPINLYGKKWRCWSRRPTDEERASAPWEESQ